MIEGLQDDTDGLYELDLPAHIGTYVLAGRPRQAARTAGYAPCVRGLSGASGMFSA